MYGYDVFVFGREELVKRQHLDKDLPDYAKLFIDDYFSLDETLIYLDPLYRNEFNWFENFKISEVLKPFLKHIYMNTICISMWIMKNLLRGFITS